MAPGRALVTYVGDCFAERVTAEERHRLTALALLRKVRKDLVSPFGAILASPFAARSR